MAKKRPVVTARTMERRERLADDAVKLKEKRKAREDLRRAAREAEARRNRAIELSSLEGQLAMLRPGVGHDVVRASLENRRKLLQALVKK